MEALFCLYSSINEVSRASYFLGKNRFPEWKLLSVTYGISNLLASQFNLRPVNFVKFLNSCQMSCSNSMCVLLSV